MDKWTSEVSDELNGQPTRAAFTALIPEADKVLPIDVAYPASYLRICADHFDEVAVGRFGVVMVGRKSQLVWHGVIRSILQLGDARPFDWHPRRVRTAQEVALRVLVDRGGGREEPHLETPLAQFAQPYSCGL